jgi:septal ring factor EnvC (AmiA/AmiB activator)
MWLTGCLAPDFKTIADFRKDNGPAIRKVCREFIVVCGRAGVLTATAVAIDGSKFKAVNSRDRNFTKAKVAKRLEQIEASIERYLSQLEIADRQPEVLEIKRTHLENKIGRLKQEIERMKATGAELGEAEDTQISLTDPSANRIAVCRAARARCKGQEKPREPSATTFNLLWKPSTISSLLTKSPMPSTTGASS